MNLTSIHHIAIICSDYKTSKHFYVETLGFKALQEKYRKEKQSYKLDLEVNKQCYIELFSFPNSPSRVSKPEACGLRHLAFSVENIHIFSDKLRMKGVEVEDIRIDPYTRKLYTFFRDPDGLPLELYEA